MTFMRNSRPCRAFDLRIAPFLSQLLGTMPSLSQLILEHPRVFQHLALPCTWREFLDLLGDEARPHTPRWDTEVRRRKAVTRDEVVVDSIRHFPGQPRMK